MPAVILNACAAINLYASGQFVSVLSALEHEWHLPAAVLPEAKFIRQPDPDDSARLVPVAIDLGPMFVAGVLTRCDCETDAELELYVRLAAQIRDDGEAMGLAIAHNRGWSIVTDDRKARRIAGELDVTVLSTPELMKAWAVNRTDKQVADALGRIERFARFTPNSTLPEYAWWIRRVP